MEHGKRKLEENQPTEGIYKVTKTTVTEDKVQADMKSLPEVVNKMTTNQQTAGLPAPLERDEEKQQQTTGLSTPVHHEEKRGRHWYTVDDVVMLEDTDEDDIDGEDDIVGVDHDNDGEQHDSDGDGDGDDSTSDNPDNYF